MIIQKGTQPEPHFVIEVVDDPVSNARLKEQHERFKRNSDWLQSHWSDVLPQAFGKCLVVAGQQAFIADTGREALALAKAAHPDDTGLLIQYVNPHPGPRY